MSCRDPRCRPRPARRARRRPHRSPAVRSRPFRRRPATPPTAPSYFVSAPRAAAAFPAPASAASVDRVAAIGSKDCRLRLGTKRNLATPAHLRWPPVAGVNQRRHQRRQRRQNPGAFGGAHDPRERQAGRDIGSAEKHERAAAAEDREISVRVGDGRGLAGVLVQVAVRVAEHRRARHIAVNCPALVAVDDLYWIVCEMLWLAP